MWQSGLTQRLAKPSNLAIGSVGSNPTISAKFSRLNFRRRCDESGNCPQLRRVCTSVKDHYHPERGNGSGRQPVAILVDEPY